MLQKITEIINQGLAQARLVEDVAPLSMHYLVTNVFEISANIVDLKQENQLENFENLNKTILAIIAKKFTNVEDFIEFAEKFKRDSEAAGHTIPPVSTFELFDTIDEMANCPDCGESIPDYVASIPDVISAISNNLLKLITYYSVNHEQELPEALDELNNQIKLQMLKLLLLYMMQFAKEGCSIFHITDKMRG